MKEIPNEDLKNWILAQPNHRPVNMKQASGRSDCGCVMVQFAKEVLKLKASDISCGFEIFGHKTETKLKESIYYFIVACEKAQTFGELKQNIHLIYEMPPTN